MVSPVFSLNAAALKDGSKLVSVESKAGNLPALFLVPVSKEYFLTRLLKLLPFLSSAVICSAFDFLETKMC